MAVFYSYGLDIGGKNGTILSQIEVTSSSIVLKSIGTIKSLDTIDKIFKENRVRTFTRKYLGNAFQSHRIS